MELDVSVITVRIRYSLTILLLVMLVGCVGGQQQPRLDNITVEVTGDDFNWHFRYPGNDGVLGTYDDRYSLQHLYLPDNASVTLRLRSNDYVYSFSLPDLGMREVAVPGMDFKLQFTTQGEGISQLLGDQMCGFSHASLMGKVVVRDQDDGFYGW